MPHSIAFEGQDRAASQFILMLAGLFFGGAPAFGIGYAIARKYRILSDSRIYAVTGVLGLTLGGLLMLWLRENGTFFAFFSLIGLFFGVRRGSVINAYRRQRAKMLARRRQE